MPRCLPLRFNGHITKQSHLLSVDNKQCIYIALIKRQTFNVAWLSGHHKVTISDHKVAGSSPTVT